MRCISAPTAREGGSGWRSQRGLSGGCRVGRDRARAAPRGRPRVQRRVPALSRQPPADDAAWRCIGSAPIGRAAGAVLRKLPRHEPSRADAAAGRADRARRTGPSALGDRSRETRLPRASFATRSAASASAAAIAAYLPTLISGDRGERDALAFMRLAYGVMRNDPAEVGAALGYWSAMYLSLGRATGAAPVTDDPAEVLAPPAAGGAFRHVESRRDLLWHFMRAVAAKPEFKPVVDWLAHRPGQPLRRVAAASLALYAGTMDFCALHALTGTHWLRLIAPVLPDPERALRQFWQAIASLYPKIGFPDLPSAEMLQAWRTAPLSGLAGDQGRRRRDATTSTISAWPSRPSRNGRSMATRSIGSSRRAGCGSFLERARPSSPTRSSPMDAASTSASRTGRSPRSASRADERGTGRAIDLAGALLLPGFVDGHIHLDKTLLGLPFQPHRPGDTSPSASSARRSCAASSPIRSRSGRSS